MYYIYSLKCNGMRNPKGIADGRPLFSWKLSAGEGSENQKAYRIVVVDENGNEAWDSEITESQEVADIVYEGRSLSSHTLYRWSVTSYSSKGDASKSEDAFFSMGMLEDEWKAKWIEGTASRKSGEECTEMSRIFSGEVTSSAHPEAFLNPPLYFRREFFVRNHVKKAIVYATARGIYQLRMNGTIVSDLLAPEYTSYPNYLEVQQYDITEHLQEGSQTIGVILADGWFTGKIGLVGIGNQYGDNNAFYMQLMLFYEDGRQETVISDENFKWNTGNYEYADLFIGECFHQNKLPEEWQLCGYDDSNWKFAVERAYGTGCFKGRKAEPVRVLRRYGAKDIFYTAAQELIIDAGENIVGYLWLKMKGRKGQKVRFTHSEVLDKNGNFLMNIIGQNKNQTDVYLFAEDGVAEYEPCFTFHGFQYVKVEGLGKENLLDVNVCVLGSDLERTGSFTCSDARINRLQENIFRSQQGNMLSIPTDCPQRERAGWTGDMQIYAPTACFHMDMMSFLGKWLENMRYEQLPDGQICNIVPMMDSDKYVTNSRTKHICSAAWGDACVIIPYVLYWKYGNRKILEENFTMMEKWLQYVEGQAATSFLKPVLEYRMEELLCQKYLWNTEFHFGDWLFPSGGAPFDTANATKEYVAPAFFAYTSGLMAEICEVLGKKEKSLHYKSLQQKIRNAYARTYIDEEGRLPVPCQGIYVLALQMQLYPEEKKAMGIKELIKLIEDNDFCLDTGFASVGFLLDTLYENGEREAAYRLLFQTKCPSWLYEVEMGANTIWERWNAVLPDGTRTNASYNHFAFGCVGDFIYRRIGGLYAAEPGYKKVRIEPDVECGLEWAKTSYDSVYGRIEIEWERKGKQIFLQAELPPNVKGTVKVKGVTKRHPGGKLKMIFGGKRMDIKMDKL